MVERHLKYARRHFRLFAAVLGLTAQAAGSLRGQAQNGSKQSEVSSRILKMTLDHDSGNLSGMVLEGTFKDWLLEELDRQQLDELLAFCQREDADSAQLLVSYLEQRFPGEALLEVTD